MENYVAILRGINVSGHKKVNMQDLKALFTSLGYENVRTYIQSGNVLFSFKKNADTQTLISQIEKSISEKYGFEVPVIIRTIKEMEQVIKRNPFKSDCNAEQLYVTFLADEPLPADIEKTNTCQHPPDRFILEGKEVYICCVNGYGNTKLSNNFFESKLKVKATTRNWKTINTLLTC